MKFSELAIGQEFNFIKPNNSTTFYLDCVKISKTKYKDENGNTYTIGTKNAQVFNVKELKEK